MFLLNYIKYIFYIFIILFLIFYTITIINTKNKECLRKINNIKLEIEKQSLYDNLMLQKNIIVSYQKKQEKDIIIKNYEKESLNIILINKDITINNIESIINCELENIFNLSILCQ